MHVEFHTFYKGRVKLLTLIFAGDVIGQSVKPVLFQ